MSKPKEGWLKIKLHKQNRWHRKFCIVDWDKAVLFIASKTDTRYKDWIKLLPNIIINDLESSSNSESSASNVLTNTIEIVADNGTATHYLQAESPLEYKSWLLVLKQTAYSRIGGAIFGQALEDTFRYSPDKNSYVPLIVRQCCEYLLENGLTFVGLFRVPGKQSSIKALRDMYDRGLSMDLKTFYSPATVASLLKVYLQSLPEPIIPKKDFDDFLEMGSRLKYNQTSDLERLKNLIESNIPLINLAVLAYLCRFLKKVSEYVETTKMDTDNLAVVFGNNLIRPVHEVDLYMIKGHSFNLIPLVKVLIDDSDFLFANVAINLNLDSYEQTNEAVTKSSGFSSLSSLLSSNEHLTPTKVRSTSLPSLHVLPLPSCERTSFRFDIQSERSDVERQKKFLAENRSLYVSDRNNESLTYHSDRHQANKPILRHTKCASAELLDNNRVDDMVLCNTDAINALPVTQTEKFDTAPRLSSMIDIATKPPPSTKEKAEKSPTKKGFANKVGKSLLNLKSSMSRALQSHVPQNETDSQAIDTSSSLLTPRKSLDVQLSNNVSKKSHGDIDQLRELLEKKELLISQLTKQLQDERLRFENEKLKLNHIIEQLRAENNQLKKKLNPQ